MLIRTGDALNKVVFPLLGCRPMRFVLFSYRYPDPSGMFAYVLQRSLANTTFAGEPTAKGDLVAADAHDDRPASFLMTVTWALVLNPIS